MLERRLVKLTWAWAIVFLPIETYWCIVNSTFLRSDYLVNVTGVGIMLWAAISLRQGRHYAEGLLAPVLTAICAAALTGAVILLMRRDRKASSS